MARVSGFAPIVGEAPHLLILGSMPGVESLRKHEYYGKSQNAFWRIMGELYGAGPDLPYAERVGKIACAGISVWDVLASCVRPGSLDSAIETRTAQVNDFLPLLRQYAGIKHIVFNGKKAEELFIRRALPDVAKLRPAMTYAYLPSTSPAMATLDFSAKLACWRAVLEGSSGG